MNQPQLKKTIGFWSATTLVIGGIIGSTIFMKPAVMAAQLPSPILLLAVWIVGGIVSIFGAMAFAELGTMFPETGGQYVYLQKAYGDFVAYLYGWGSIVVINSAAISAIAYVFASYTGYFIHLPRFSVEVENSIRLHLPGIGDIFPLQNAGLKSLAITMLMGLTWVNWRSVKSGNAIQFIATVLKVVALLLLVLGIFFSGSGHVINLVQDGSTFQLHGFGIVTAFMAATTGALASYDGWNNLNMVAGEIKDPSRNITRSLFIGVLVCILVYVLITVAYLYVLPVDELAGSPTVASDAVARALGSNAGVTIAALIVLSTFGAVSANLLANSRVIFSMAQGGNFFAWAAKIHPRNQTPGNSVVLLGVWSSILIITGSFDILTDMFIFMSWFFYFMVVLAVFVMRRKMPDAIRPYRVKGYPWVPLCFLVFTAFYLGSTLYYDIGNYNSGKSPVINSVFSIILTLTGVPFFQNKKKKYGQKAGT